MEGQVSEEGMGYKEIQLPTLASGVQVEAGQKGFTDKEKCLFVLFLNADCRENKQHRQLNGPSRNAGNFGKKKNLSQIESWLELALWVLW